MLALKLFDVCTIPLLPKTFSHAVIKARTLFFDPNWAYWSILMTVFHLSQPSAVQDKCSRSGISGDDIVGASLMRTAPGVLWQRVARRFFEGRNQYSHVLLFNVLRNECPCSSVVVNNRAAHEAQEGYTETHRRRLETPIPMVRYRPCLCA